ncbi:MAG: polysaccharide deacetylase family protein [Myxococcota bacterium]
MTLNTDDQRYLRGTEPESASHYLDIVQHFGKKVTFFVTGRCVEEEPDVIRQLGGESDVELGGHTYNAYQPLLMHRLSKHVLGHFMGPRVIQDWSVRTTCSLLESCMPGSRVVSWRNHAYLSDENTVDCLKRQGIRNYSDMVLADEQPFAEDDLCIVPINVIPDHEHLYHGSRTEENVGRWAHETQFHDSWGTVSFDGDTWGDMVIEQTRALLTQGKVACLLIHPACMEILDNFRTFRRIMEAFADFPSATMAEWGRTFAQPEKSEHENVQRMHSKVESRAEPVRAR